MLIIIYTLALAFTFLMVSAGTKIICVCFGIAFLWRYAIGAWAALVLLRYFMGSNK